MQKKYYMVIHFKSFDMSQYFENTPQLFTPLQMIYTTKSNRKTHKLQKFTEVQQCNQGGGAGSLIDPP